MIDLSEAQFSNFGLGRFGALKFIIYFFMALFDFKTPGVVLIYPEALSITYKLMYEPCQLTMLTYAHWIHGNGSRPYCLVCLGKMRA